MNAVHTLRFQHHINILCRVLRVSRSTYYKHFHHAPAPRTLENQKIRSAILELYAKSGKRFGAYKIRQRLSVEYGISISVGRVYRLMKSIQLPKMSTIKPKAVFPANTSDSDCPNHLKQNFNPPAPNQVWVSDITYIRVNGRFYYLCVVIDLFARKIVAYRLSPKMNAQLAIDTFQSAWNDRRQPAGLLFHSDRGCQYTAKEFRTLLDDCNVVQSFSAKGHPYDNAVAESFFKFLKLEETNRKSYCSLHDLQLSLFTYIHFYNTMRPHGANSYLTPNEKELAFEEVFPS